MNLVDFLCEKALALPRPAAQLDDVLLGCDMSEFSALLHSVEDKRLPADEWQRAVTAANSLGIALEETLRLSLDARPKEARDSLGKALSEVRTYLDTLQSQRVGAEGIGNFYRVRVGCQSDPGLSGMFHIPFELRHLVCRQRYSYPGIPCLYLAQSLYCCWNEMGQPALNSMWVSRFSLAPGKTVSLVDLGWRPHWVAGLLNTNANEEAARFATAYVAMWPLIAACTYRRCFSDGSPFVTQYIIPQMLTEWLIAEAREKFDGIRYPSSHIEDEAVGLAGMSIALPARTYPHRGPCKVLGASWQATLPVRWETILACDTGRSSHRFADEEITVAGRGIRYRDTQFSRIERFLEDLPLNAIEVPNTMDGVSRRW